MIIVMTSELIIPNVAMEDTGIYICTATMDGLKKHTSVTVNVQGEYVMDRVCPITSTIVLVNKKSDFVLLVSVEHLVLSETHGTQTVVTAKEGKRQDFKTKVNALHSADKESW